MTVAPIVKSVSVPLPPARCFTLFTSHMDRWWKPDMHIAATPYRTIVIEPHAEGRWFEVDEDGHETQWGRVLAWEPPHRLLLGWQLNARFQFDPDFLTEVEVSFLAEAAGTRVVLEHRQLERFGEAAPQIATNIDGGWGALLTRYADCAGERKND